MKLFDKISENEAIERIRSWISDNEHYRNLEGKLNDKTICTSCGHFGKVQTHTRNGCNLCHTMKGCDSNKFKEERLSIKNELSIRSKALQDQHFPNEEVMNEYLVRKDNVSELNLKWRKPDMVNFVVSEICK